MNERRIRVVGLTMREAAKYHDTLTSSEPLAADLGWIVVWKKDDFIGAAPRAQKAAGVTQTDH